MPSRPLPLARRRSAGTTLGLAVLLATSIPLVLDAQSVPTKTLGRPEAEFSDPFTIISGVRELRDGRVVVADAREKTVQLVDLKSGSAQKVGREGQGPGEYSIPMRVLPLAGDTTLIHDVLNQRFLYVNPDGKPGAFWSLASGGDGGRVTITPARSIDARGRVYLQGPGFSFGPDGPQPSDSAPILRMERGAKKVDTVAYVPVARPKVSGGGGNVSISAGPPNPFAAQDGWDVLPDGRVAIVRAKDYHVDFVGPNGARTSGPAIPFDRIKVTEADKKEAIATRGQGAMVMSATRTQAGGGAPTSNTQISVGGGSGGPQIPPPTDWPEYKAPFIAGGTGILATPSGQLWVRRHEPAGTKTSLYDVFDGTGKLVQKVVLPANTRLVGFGSGTVYLSRTDADDLQYLQRYRL